jgi:hypothetical protein
MSGRIGDIIFLSCLCLSALQVKSQRLIPESRIQLTLSDSTSVILYCGVTADRVNNACYYLPVNLRISERSGKPEFSFLAYDSDGDGRNDGAIMHLLLTWGLSADQESETQTLLRSKVDSLYYLAGSFLPASDKQDIAFDIESDNPLGEVLKQSLRSRGNPPLAPGEKMALSFMFSMENTEKMEKALNNPEKLEGISFVLSYDQPGEVPGEVILLRGDFRGWMIKIRP